MSKISEEDQKIKDVWLAECHGMTPEYADYLLSLERTMPFKQVKRPALTLDAEEPDEP